MELKPKDVWVPLLVQLILDCHWLVCVWGEGLTDRSIRPVVLNSSPGDPLLCTFCMSVLSPIRTVIVSHGDVSYFHHLQGLVCEFITVWIQNASVFLPPPKIPGRITYCFLTNTKVMLEFNCCVNPHLWVYKRISIKNELFYHCRTPYGNYCTSL